jgi:hypothetical protein
VERLADRIGRALEHQGVSVRDAESSYLEVDTDAARRPAAAARVDITLEPRRWRHGCIRPTPLTPLSALRPRDSSYSKNRNPRLWVVDEDVSEESGEAGEAPGSEIRIVVNWFEELTERVPVE